QRQTRRSQRRHPSSHRKPRWVSALRRVWCISTNMARKNSMPSRSACSLSWVRVLSTAFHLHLVTWLGAWRPVSADAILVSGTSLLRFSLVYPGATQQREVEDVWNRGTPP